MDSSSHGQYYTNIVGPPPGLTHPGSVQTTPIVYAVSHPSFTTPTDPIQHPPHHPPCYPLQLPFPRSPIEFPPPPIPLQLSPVYHHPFQHVAPISSFYPPPPPPPPPPSFTYPTINAPQTNIHTSNSIDQSQQQPPQQQHYSKHDPTVHRDWLGRLAPLAGFTSPPGLRPPPLPLSSSARPRTTTSTRPPAVPLPKPGSSNSLSAPRFTHSLSSSASSSPSLSPSSRYGVSPSSSSSVTTITTQSPFSYPPELNNNETSQNEPHYFTLNKFADSFIPQYLKTVQASVHRMTPLPPIPRFPDPSYLSTFLPQRLISEFSFFSDPSPSDNINNKNNNDSANNCKFTSLISCPPPTSSSSPNLPTKTLSSTKIAPPLPLLHPESYHKRWRLLLGFELAQIAHDKTHTVLWQTSLKIWNFDQSEFAVHVPGIRENYPKLDPGDLIHLREVFKDHQTLSGNAFEGRILILRKREGVVHFYSLELKKHVEIFFPSKPHSTHFDNNSNNNSTHNHNSTESSTDFDRGGTLGAVGSGEPGGGASGREVAAWGNGDELPIYFNLSFLANPRAFVDMDLACQALSEDLESEVRGKGMGAGAGVGRGGKEDNPSSHKNNHRDSNAPSHVHFREHMHTHAHAHARRWLFPQHNDLGASFLLDQDVQEIDRSCLIDQGLNDEQLHAVSSIAVRHWPVPYLISGPPGTGKTRTIVESILQILRLHPDANVLVCAPSNPATDILALRLKEHLQPREMLRLNDVTRTFAEVPISIFQYCYVVNDKFGFPPWEQLMSYRVVVCSCLDAMLLSKAHCTNRALARLEQMIMNGLYPAERRRRQRQHRCNVSGGDGGGGTNKRVNKRSEFKVAGGAEIGGGGGMVKPHWTHLLIDEAAQGMEAELAIPISIMLTQQSPPPSSSASTTTGIIGGEDNATDGSDHVRMSDDIFPDGILSPQLVLCGDPNQLGPIVSSWQALDGGLGISLLERLFHRSLYSEHELARSKMTAMTMSRRMGYVPRERSGAVPFTNLVKNYRSHPAILMTPSALFYDDTLEPFAHENGFVHWSGLNNRDFPLKFIGHDYGEDCNDERVNFYNLGDIQRIVETVQSLLVVGTTTGTTATTAAVATGTVADPPLRPSQIGVIAPWREQVWKIRERLRKEGFAEVDVGTVEDYQGRENRVIIVSCVRSDSRFLGEDEEKGLGLVFERKRMNVALTRSKELLIVIGNGQFLMKDPYWRSYLQFAIRNKLYTGPRLDIDSDPNYISRLESVYMKASGTEKELDVDERAFRLAGDVAREALREC